MIILGKYFLVTPRLLKFHLDFIIDTQINIQIIFFNHTKRHQWWMEELTESNEGVMSLKDILQLKNTVETH